MISINSLIESAKDKTIKNYYDDDNIKLINIIKDFCINNDIILEYEKSIEFKFILYSTKPYKDSNNLSNILFDTGNYNYIILHTKIVNTELMISINNQRLIYFKLLFNPTPIIFEKFNIEKKYKLLQLPTIIKILNNINKKCEISNLVENFKKNDLEFYDIEELLEQYKSNNNNTKFNNVKNIIINELLLFVKTLNIILLDYYIINKTYNNFNNTIQIIYQDNIISEIKNKIKEILNINNISGEVIINNDRTYIIDNFRLKKTLIYVSIYDKKYKSFNKFNIINCFNELSYNIIPVLKINPIEPHPFIIIKYLIINIIYLYLYSNDKHNNFALYISYLGNFLKKIDDINSDDYKFIGIYKNEELDLKLNQVYRPYQYYLKNEELRDV